MRVPSRFMRKIVCRLRLRLTLSFDAVEELAGVPLDHSFLSCKKELTAYGYAVGRISMKNRTVLFIKSEEVP